MGLLGQGREEINCFGDNASLWIKRTLECSKTYDETLPSLDSLRLTFSLLLCSVPKNPFYCPFLSDQKSSGNKICNRLTSAKGKIV
jgi:hypothetical protein